MLLLHQLNLRRSPSILMRAEEEYNEDFNPDAGDERRVALACPTTGYAIEDRNIFEELFFG